MRISAYLITAIALCSLTGNLFAQGEKISLKPKFIPGKKYVIEQLIDQTSSVPTPQGQAQEMKMKMSMQMGMTVTQESADEKKVTMTVDGMVMNMDMGGQEMKMDASDPAQKETLGKALEMMPVLIYSNDDKFIRIEGMDNSANPVLAKIMSADSIKQIVNGSMEYMPTEPIAPGHEWEQDVKMPMEGIGEMSVASKYKFEKMEMVDGVSCARISFQGTIEGGINAETATISFEDTDIRGLMFFDPSIGYIRKQEMHNKLTMKMQLPGQDQITMPLDQKQTVILKSLEDVK